MAAKKRHIKDDVDETQEDIETFVFLDLETTGLFPEKPRITEMCLLAVNKQDLCKIEFPRVVNKLRLCFNPEKPLTEGASRVSGLSLDMLRPQKPLKSESVSLINAFLGHLQEPVCLLAHNGNGFDFPLLMSEISMAMQSGALNASVLCADTLEAFRYLDSVPTETDYGNLRDRPKKKRAETQVLYKRTHDKPESMPHNIRRGTKGKQPLQKKQGSKPLEVGVPGMLKSISSPSSFSDTKKSFKLADVYKRIVGKEPSDVHTAEGDCVITMEIAQHLPRFVDWVNQNATKFSSIQPVDM